jgi:hypothetical protein
MAVPIVTGTSYNQEIQRSDRSVTQDARSITETTSESTTVRSGGSRTITVPPSSTTNAISPSQEVSAVVPSLSTSAASTPGAPTRQQRVASPAANPVAPKSAPPTRQQQAAPSKQETSPRGAKTNDADRVKEAAITAQRQAALKAEISQIRAGSGNALEKQRKINEAQKKSAAVAQARANDTLDVRRYNRVTSATQAEILKRDPNLQRLEAQGRIARPSKTDKNTKPVKGKPTPAPSNQQQPKLELNVNQGDRIQTSGQSISERFDINSFRSEMLFNDVLPSHSYLVTFAPFRTFSGNVNLDFSENIPLTRFVSEKRNTLMMRCENIVLPSPALLEEENIRRYGYGPVEKIPYGVQFGDVTMTWVVDKNSEIIDFFHQWMNTIVMHDSKNASVGPGTTRPGLANYLPFEVGYKDSYANPIVRIYVYNRQQETVTEYEMYDVFPMNIQAMNLSWTDENQIQKLTVTFAYTNMSMSAPQKTSTQFNFYEQVSDAVSPYEHFQAADFFQKSVDIAPSPTGEPVTRTVNASRPYFAESHPLGLEKTYTGTTEAAPPLTNSGRTRLL